MAVLSRGNELAQQRLDLTTVLAIESYTAFDFRSLMTFFTGSSSVYILRGLHITGSSGLTISINQADASLINPQDGNGSFYRGLPSDSDILLTLPASQPNVFVELAFKNVTAAPATAAFWNPLALTGSDVAGDEFSAASDSQVIMQLVVTANTTGFTPGSTPLYQITTDSAGIITTKDSRNLLFRLGSGGVTPNPSHRYPWSVNRHDPVISGPGSNNDSNSSFLRQDGTGILNDKGIYSFKDWMDAVMTRFMEVTGSSLWYSSGAANVPVTGLTLSSAFFDSDNGSYINPSSTNALIWSKDTGTGELTLRSNGTAISAGRGTVEWQYNYGPIRWELGGTFTNDTPGGSRTYSVPTFTSPTPVDGGNIYLFLEREIPKGSGNSIQWASNAADAVNLTNPSQDVSGQAGDFTGIAVGDYIRKISEGYSRYNQVTKMVDGLGGVYTTVGYIADSTITGLELADPILSGTSTESLIYFRSRYSNADLYADLVVGEYNYRDIDYNWLGRRVGQNFILRNHGTIQPGEKFKIEDSSSINGVTTGDSGTGLMLEHSKQAAFSQNFGWYLKTGTGPLMTIRRRKRDNTVPSPGPLNTQNSDGYLTYLFPFDELGLTIGDCLWVKLNDSAGGTLSSGNVTDPTDAANDTNTVTNVYQILSASQTPLRTYNNRDVYLLARCIDTNKLQFCDDTILDDYGILITTNERVDGNLQVTGTISLPAYTPHSVLFIDTANNVAEDNANLAYNQSTAKFTALNYLFGVNTLEQIVPEDMTWFSTIGPHTLTAMSAGSTLRLKGALIVDQGITSSSSTTLVSEDKTLTLGVGNLSDGGSGNGINVADNTLFATSYSTTSGSSKVTSTYASAHGYVLGDLIGVEASDSVGSITAGQINLTYTVVASATLAGQAEIVDSTHMLFVTNGTSNRNDTVTTSPTVTFKSYLTPSSIYLTAADGTPTNMTSWGFTVKGKNTVTLTPVTGYTVIPTLNSSEALAGRIMFSGSDSSGPSGITTTIDEDSQLFWDNSNKNLGVGTSTPTAKLAVALGAAPGGSVPTSMATLVSGPTGVTSGWAVGDKVGYLNIVDTGSDSTSYWGFSTFDYSSSTPFQMILQGNGGNLSIGTSLAWYALLTLGTDTTTAAGGMYFGSDTNLYRSGASSLTTDGSFTAGSFAIAGGTQGSVLFLNSTGTITQDNSKFYWDDTNFRLGVGKIPTAYNLEVKATSNSGISVTNSTAGQVSSVVAFNDAGNYVSQFMTGSSFSSGIQTADTGILGTVGTGGLLLASFNSAAPLRFATNGAEVARFDGTGKFGIGATVPGQLLDVANKFQVDSNGNILKLRNVTTSFPASQGAANTVLSNDGSGNLSWATPLLGGLYLNYATTKTSTYTIGTTETVIPVDTTGGSFSINLPAATSGNKGQVVIIKDVGNFIATNAYTLVPDGSDTIDGTNASIVINFGNGTALQLISNGSGGWILT